jgi:hypothetical protein
VAVGCEVVVLPERFRCPLWVNRDRVEPAASPAMSVMPPKAEERYGFAHPATRAGSVPADRCQ